MTSETPSPAAAVAPEIPSWYCPFKLEPNALGMFQPLVFLAGLDVSTNPVHRAIWETMNFSHAGGGVKDFQPTYITVPLDHRFPFKQTKAENVEGFIPSPKGILRSNWIYKHTQQIPSAVVVFFDMNWSDPQWNDRKMELAKTVKDLKLSLIPHGVQILVLLVRPHGIVDENFSTERASALCAAADIPPKYLFVLSHTHAERIQACIQRLEIGMRELAKIYYTARIKKVKSWKDKSTQTPLLVRYNFKIGFFQEIRKDYVTALSHYHAATDALLSIKMTDANVQELKVVASILNYRICRVQLLKQDAKESKAQFDKHIRSFFKLEGNPALLFEHLAWLETQYHIFGELLKQHYRSGPNFPDPITYFLMASTYSEKRKTFFLERFRNVQMHWPSEFDQFRGEMNLQFVGQRPWRTDSFRLDNLYTVEDPRAIAALQYLESLTRHSDIIIFHLGIASDLCRELHRGRTRCQLMSQMGVEFLSAKEYSKCIMLMTHVLREFGNADWKFIIYQVADCGLKASSCEGDVPSYCNFLITLLKLDLNEFVTAERRQLLWSKFQSVINGKIPLQEEGYYEMNAHRWESSFSSPTPLTSYVEVHKEPIVECQAFSPAEIVHIGSAVQVKFIIRNRHEFPVSIRKYGIRTNIVDYKCEMDTNLKLQSGEVAELELSFKPLLRDVGKVVQIQVAYLDIGKDKRSVLLHYALAGPYNLYLWDNEGKKEQRFSLIKIEPTQTLLEVKITRQPHMLLNEWFKVVISWQNNDSVPYNRIAIGCQLSTTDSQKATISTDPQQKRDFGLVTHTLDIPQIGAKSSHDAELYLKCSNPVETEVKFLIKGRYFDGFHQPMTIEHTEIIPVLNPFEIKQTLTNLQLEPLEHISVDEEFILHFSITNTSSSSIRLENWNLVNSKTKSYKLNEVDYQLAKNGGLLLNEREEASFSSFIVPLSSLEPVIGHYEIEWKRNEADSINSTTEIDVAPFTFSDSPLYLRAIFADSGMGKLKQPMTASYTLFNRTSRVHDLIVSMDSSAEAFMNAGPKKVTLKLNGKDYVEFSYILFPLRTGLLKAPKLIVENAPNGTTILEPTLLPVHKDCPSAIFISP